MADKNIYWSKTALTGGGATALDSIDGTGLQDGEVAHVWISNVLYIYLLDVDSGAAESSPAIIAPATNAGDKRWILQSYYSGSGTLYTDHIAESTAAHGVEIDGLTIKDSGFALGSDADGDMYYRASSALARLAKGTANFKQFMNAAGTAPEWAAGYSITAHTRDMAADTATGVAFSGAGFKPSAAVILTIIDQTVNTCVGFSTFTTSYSIVTVASGVNWKTPYSPCVIAKDVVDDRQSLTSFTAASDGATGTWTKVGTPTGTADIYILWIR